MIYRLTKICTVPSCVFNPDPVFQSARMSVVVTKLKRRLYFNRSRFSSRLAFQLAPHFSFSSFGSRWKNVAGNVMDERGPART